jgi:hypothetical protein
MVVFTSSPISVIFDLLASTTTTSLYTPAFINILTGFVLPDGMAFNTSCMLWYFEELSFETVY